MFKPVLRKFIRWLLSTRLCAFFVKYVIPEVKFFHAPGPSWRVKQDFKQTMRIGDILLSKSRGHLTNLLIPGKFSHAAIVIGKNKIAEMKANDFDVVDFEHFSKHTTRLALLRLRPYEKEYARQMANKAMSFSSARYDRLFSLGVDALYCSELCYEADFQRRMKADLSDLEGLGQKYISPVGLYEAPGLHAVLEWEDRL